MRTVLLTLCLILSCSPRALAQQTQFTWNFAGPPGSSDRILALATDPRNEAVIFAATPGGGLWKTADSGTTWAALFDTQPSLQVCSVAIDPREPDVIYAGTGDTESPRPSQGVTRSADGGQNWTTLPRITDHPVCALAVDPWIYGQVFAGSDDGLFLSRDAGASWTRMLESPVTSIAFDSTGVLYVGALGDTTPGSRSRILKRSSDSGRSWTDLPLPQNAAAPDSPATWVAIRINGSTLHVAVAYQTQLDFYTSSDGGYQWTTAFAIGQVRPPMSLIVHSNGRLYLAATALLTSADAGATWTVLTTKTGQFHSVVASFDRLVLAGEKGLEAITPTGVAKTISPIPVAQIMGVDIDVTGLIWAGGPSGLFILLPSLDFVKANVASAGRVGLAEAGSGASTIVSAGTTRVYASTDSGGHFSTTTVIPEDELRAPYPPVVVDPVITSSAFVAGRRLYHTSNSGNTWTAMRIIDSDPTRVVVALAMAPAARSTLFAATACLPEVTLTTCPAISVIWRSTNAGQTWTQMSVVSGFVNKFAIDPRQTNRVYAAIGAFPGGPSIQAGLVPGDLLLSTNSGGTWSSVLGNLPRTTINTVLIDPESLPPQFNLPALIVYVGTSAGVFVNFDASANTPRWVDISRGLPATAITDLALLQPDAVLVAGTFGRGVYRASVTGLAANLIVHPLSQELTVMRGTTLNAGIGLDNVSISSTTGWELGTSETWLVLPQPAGNLRPLVSTQVPIQISATDLKPGTYVGRLKVTTSLSVQNATVQVRVTPGAGDMEIAAGYGAAGLPGTTLPPLQVLVFDENREPLPGAPVNFTIIFGSGTLSARSAVTNESGIASVVLTLPKQPGTVQVQATLGRLSVVFNAIAIAAPAVLRDSVLDAVTFNANTSFGPGTILLIGGQNLANSDAAAERSLQYSLAGTQVLMTTPAGDVALPLFSVSATQVKALIPYDTAPGTYLLRVEASTIRGNNVEISVAPFSPGIATVNANGRGPGVFVKSDGSIVSALNPADRGSTIILYASGMGAVNPAADATQPGASAEPLNRTIQTPSVFFDRYSAPATYSGLARGIAGWYQVAVQVPLLVAPATNVSVSLTIGGYTSNRVAIPVR